MERKRDREIERDKHTDLLYSSQFIVGKKTCKMYLVDPLDGGTESKKSPGLA